MANENNFILSFASCPSCGSEERISSLTSQEYIDKGEMSKDAVVALERVMIVLKDPRKAVLTAPTLLLLYDICAKCGARYCIKAEKTDLPIKFTGKGLAGMNPPGQFEGPFPRGQNA